MTKQESFKRRVRARMDKTGERYAAARRALVEQTDNRSGRHWVADPETADETLLAATGKGWDQWCDVIEAVPGLGNDHSAIAAHLSGELGVDPWWSQSITVGYERITGLRLPYQRRDGTFTAGKSATVRVDGADLRRMLLSDEARRDLFPGMDTELRSKPASKTIRIAIGPGVALMDIDETTDGRVKVSVAHERLSAFDDVEAWKFYWSEWLTAIDDADGPR